MAPKKRVKMPARKNTGGDRPTLQNQAQASHSSASTSQAPPESPPPPFEFRNAAQRERYKALSTRVISPTRYLDEDALVHLELIEDVQTYIHNIGWEKFVNLRLPTYSTLTLEFLSSLSSNVQPYGIPPMSIQFRMFNTEHTLSVEEINDIYGFDNNGMAVFPTGVQSNNVWRELTGGWGYNPRLAKSTGLRDPALRYLHRVMSHTILARKESTGVVCNSSLFLLWAMLHGHRVNTCFALCKHLMEIARATTGEIMIGGLITPIAIRLRHTLRPPLYLPIPGEDRIGLSTMLRMHMCTKVGGNYYLLDANGQIVPRRGAPIPPPVASPEPHIPMDTEVHASEPSSHLPPAQGECSLAQVMACLERLGNDFASFRQECSHRFDMIEGKLDELMDASVAVASDDDAD